VGIARHAKHAIATTTIVLNGTLTVDNKAASTSMDVEGDTTTSIPVAGQLGALDEVHGNRQETVDSLGDYMGPDTIQLRNSCGTFVIQFNEQRIKAVHHLAGGGVEHVDPQIGSQGTGAYAGARESGTIELAGNAAHTQIESLTLSS
jgi:hypothetical protein